MKLFQQLEALGVLKNCFKMNTLVKHLDESDGWQTDVPSRDMMIQEYQSRKDVF
jgi:hypothetical protein